MGVDDIGPPFIGQRNDRRGERFDLAHLAQWRRAGRGAGRAVERQPVCFFGRAVQHRFEIMALPGDASNYAWIVSVLCRYDI